MFRSLAAHTIPHVKRVFRDASIARDSFEILSRPLSVPFVPAYTDPMLM